MDAALAPRPGSLVPRRLFLNRCASTCVVTRGVDDSRFDRSSIVPGTRTLTGYRGGDAGFAALTGCVRAAFQRYNVEVTTSDPGNLPHFEVMVGGNPSNLGFSQGVLGLAPWAGGGLIANPIAFVFSQAHGNDPFEVCGTASHEGGHLMGLEHEILADDYMSYLDSTQKLFVDADANCGEFPPRPCDFGGNQQNSCRRLGLTVGVTPQVFANGFEPAPAAAILRRTNAPTQPFTCATDTSKISLPPSIYRTPSGPARRAENDVPGDFGQIALRLSRQARPCRRGRRCHHRLAPAPLREISDLPGK